MELHDDTERAIEGKWAITTRERLTIGVLEPSGHAHQGVGAGQPVVLEHRRPVVAHVVDVGHVEQRGEGRTDQPRLLVGMHDVVAEGAGG